MCDHPCLKLQGIFCYILYWSLAFIHARVSLHPYRNLSLKACLDLDGHKPLSLDLDPDPIYPIFRNL